MPTPITAEDRARILQLHAQGMTRNDIARQVHRSGETVSRIVQDAGGSFARSDQVQAATQARQADNRARRAEIIARLYAEAEAKLTELEQVRAGRRRWRTLTKGQGGAEDVEDLDFIPARDFQQVGQTVGFFAAHAAKLEQVDADRGEQQARGLLQQVADQLGIQGP